MIDTESLKNKLTRASEVYGEQTVIRALINAIPNVGGSIDILLSTRGQQFTQKRIETFIQELSAQIAMLNDTKINADYLETEEAFDIIVKALSTSAKTRQREKIKMFANIVKNALVEENTFDDDKPEIYLKIIDELSVKEMQFAIFLFKNAEATGDMKINYNAFDLSKAHTQFSLDELKFILMRLAKMGLLNEFTITTMGSGFNAYQISGIFKDFEQFIDDNILTEIASQ